MARELGVTKLMSVTDAKEKCPQLVLVKGEDLTHYREMSYKVTGRLERLITQDDLSPFVGCVILGCRNRFCLDLNCALPAVFPH